MDISWLTCLFSGLSLLIISILIKHCLETQGQPEPEPKQAEDIESKVLTRQEKVLEYKNNPGHKFLPRSERRLKERQLAKYLESQERSRTKGVKRLEPVRKDPPVKKISRMNRQPKARQPSVSLPVKPWKSLISCTTVSFYHKLCIYTALPFLTFYLFCQSLRFYLTESYLVEVEGELLSGSESGSESGSDEAEWCELSLVLTHPLNSREN